MKEKVGDDSDMFTDNYLVNFASGLKNTEELFSLLVLYGKYLATFRDTLIKRMSEMNTLTYDDRIIDRLYFQSSNENMNDRMVLKAYVNNVYRSNCSLPTTASIYTVVFMACYEFREIRLSQSVEWIQRGDQYRPHLAKLMMELLNLNDAFYIKESDILNALMAVKDFYEIESAFMNDKTDELIQKMQDTQISMEKKTAIRVAVFRLRDLYSPNGPAKDAFLSAYRDMVVSEKKRNALQSITDYQPYASYLSEDLYDYTAILLATSAKYAEKDPHRFTLTLGEIVMEISKEVPNMKENYKIYRLMFKQLLGKILTVGDVTKSQYVHALGIVDSLPYQGVIDFYVNDGTEPNGSDEEDEETGSVESPVILDAAPGMEAANKSSTTIQQGSEKIYNAYKLYKRKADIVDSQLTKMGNAASRLFIGDVKKEVIAGKDFTPMGLLKKALGTAALFAFGPIKGIIALVVRTALRKKISRAERKKIIIELQREIEIIEEKIQDARGDNNRRAKYAMMRTKSELVAALERIEYGLEADQKATANANKTISKARGY